MLSDYDLSTSTFHIVFYLYLEYMKIAFSTLALLCCLCIWSQDGEIDNSFGDQGFVHFEELQGLGAYGQKVEITDDFIFVLNHDGVVIKLDHNGETDDNFGDAGWYSPVTSNNHEITARDIHVFSSGSFLIGGRVIDVNGHSHGAIQKHWSNGSLQYGFGNEGIAVVTHPGYEGLVIYDIFKCPDGSVLACGQAKNTNNSSCVGVIIRLSEDGELDLEFGVDGIVTIGGLWCVQANNVTQIGESIFVRGGDWGEFKWGSFTRRYDLNGQSQGNVGSLSGDEYTLLDAQAPYDNSRMISGLVEVDPPGATIQVHRHMSNGDHDTSFGDQGIVELEEFNDSNLRAWDIEVQEDGKILICSNEGNLVIYRLLENGDFDLAFGDGGIFTLEDSMQCYSRSLATNSSHVYVACACDINGEEKGGERTSLTRLDYALNVESQPDVGEFELYPNPSTGLINVQLPQGIASAGTIILCDMQGREVYRENGLPRISTSFDIQIPGHLPDGLYLVRLPTSAGLLAQKLMIVR